MIYLKFCGTQGEQPIMQRVICTTDYSLSLHPTGVRVYYRPGCFDTVGANDWLNCFVMSETGKTIDKIEA